MSIRGKILFWFLLPTILMGIITAIIVYYSIRNTVEQNIFDQLVIATDKLQQRVRTYLQGKEGRNIDFSSDGFIRDCTEEITEKESRREYYTNRLNTHLVNKKSLDPDIFEVFVVDFNGSVIASTEKRYIGKDVSSEKYFSEAERLSAFASDPHYDIHLKEIVVNFSTVILSKIEREPIGIIVNRIRIEQKNDNMLRGDSVRQDFENNYSQLVAVNKTRVLDFSSDGFIRDCTEEITKREDRIKYYSDRLNKHLIMNKQPLDPSILEVFIVSLDGRVISSTETSLIGKDDSGEIYFSETMRRGSFISDLHYSPEFKQNTIEVARLLFNREGHKLIGMIFNRYRGDSFRRITHSGISEEFQELMRREGLGKTGELYIVNGDKLMITESRFIKDAILKQVVETKGVQTTFDNRTGMIGLYTNYRGIPVLGVSRYFEEMEWVILAEKDVSEAFAPIRNLRNITIIIGTIGTMFIITIAIFLAGGITKPIKKLIEGTGRIASGNLERPITISKRKDELKWLAESFNLMMCKLKDSKGKNDQLFLEVKRSRDEWQKTFDAITDGLSIHGADHTVRKLNLAMQDMLNVTSEQAVTMKCNELIYERDRPLDICPFNKKEENVRPDSMEVGIDRLGKTFLVSTYPILASCGKLIGCVHSMKDITEQKKKEDEKECINNINRIIATSLDIRDVYEGINAEIGKLIDFDNLSITLVAEDGNMIDIFSITKDDNYHSTDDDCRHEVGPACASHADRLASGRDEMQQDKRYPKKGSATGEVIDTCKPIITEDTAEGIFLTDDKLFKEGIRSHLSFPLVHKGEAIGAINFSSKVINNYFRGQFDLLSQIAPQLAIAVVNTRLYLKTKKSEEDIRKYSLDLEKKNQELIEMHKNVERQRRVLQRLSERTVLIQEEERKKLSRELHDQTGQALVALKTNLEIIDQLLPEHANDARHRLLKSKHLLVKTMEDVRSLSFCLRPPMLDDLGLIPTIKSYSRDFSTRTKIDVDVKSNLKGEKLQSNLALSLYRMVQEALTNISKHSGAKTVQINVYHENSNLVLSIKDDGKGFDIEKISQDGVLEHGLGLLGMKERFASMGAEFQILSKESKGTELIAKCQMKT